MRCKTSLFVLSMLFAQSDEASGVKLGQPIGQAQKERDAESGYPELDKFSKDDHEWAQSYVDAKTGSTKTPFQVGEEAAAEAAADLKKDFWDKPYFTINPNLVVPDYDGNKYVTTHRCFGHVCKADEDAFVQTGDQIAFTDHPDPEGETQLEKIQRGKQILRAMRNDDPGIGKLGLNLKMGDENISIA